MVNNSFANFIRYLSSHAPAISRLRAPTYMERPRVINGDEINGDLKLSIGKTLSANKLEVQFNKNETNAKSSGGALSQMITNILAVHGDTSVYALLLAASSTPDEYVTHPQLNINELPQSPFYFKGAIDNMSDTQIISRYLFGSIYNALPPYEEASFGMSVLACAAADRQSFYQYRSLANPHLRLLESGGLFVLRTFSDSSNDAIRELMLEFDLFSKSRLSQRILALFSEWIKLRDNHAPGSNSDNPFLRSGNNASMLIIQGLTKLREDLETILDNVPHLYEQDIADGIAISSAVVLYQSCLQLCFDDGTVPTFGENVKLIALCCGLALSQPIVAVDVQGKKGSLMAMISSVVESSAVWMEAAKATAFDENSFTSFFFREHNPTNDILNGVIDTFVSHFDIKRKAIGMLSIAGCARYLKGNKAYVNDISSTVSSSTSGVNASTITKGVRVVKAIANVAKYLL